MACDLLNALKGTTGDCKITMAGTGDRVYFFDKDVWAGSISEGAGADDDTSLPTPGYMGYYGVDEAGAPDSDAVAKLNKLELFAVDIKTDSGQVTSEKGADNEASSQKATFVVDGNIQAWNEVAHTLAFKNWGCIVPRVGGGYYMVMSPYKKCKIENNYDSGTTYDSDHGFTVNIDASPAEYGVTFLPDGSKIGTSAMAKTDIQVTTSTTSGVTTTTVSINVA